LNSLNIFSGATGVKKSNRVGSTAAAFPAVGQVFETDRVCKTTPKSGCPWSRCLVSTLIGKIDMQVVKIQIHVFKAKNGGPEFRRRCCVPVAQSDRAAAF